MGTRSRMWYSKGIYFCWWWCILSGLSLRIDNAPVTQYPRLTDSPAFIATTQIFGEPHPIFDFLGPRQLPAPEPIPAPAIPAPAPTSPALVPADIPIFISIIPDSSSPTALSPASTSNTTATPSSSSSSSSNNATSSSISSSSSSSSSTSPTISTFNPPKLTLSTFLPFISAVGFILLLLFLWLLWLLYGCCTRKPRRKIHGREWDLDRDGEELVCGPPYSSSYRPGGMPEPDFEYGDAERGGVLGLGQRSGHSRYREYQQDEEEEEEGLLNRPKRLHLSRWPSFNSPPTFDPSRGFHVPAHYGEGDDLDATLMAIPPLSQIGKGKSRSQASHTTQKTSRSWMSKYSLSTARTTSDVPGPSKPSKSRSHSHSKSPSRSRPTMHPHQSTSSASTFLQLYSDSGSDDNKDPASQHDDDDDKSSRALLDVPWESLRHKSIKRGILEQVRKGKERESKWMDSIRSGGELFLASLSGSLRGSISSRDREKEKEKDGREEEGGLFEGTAAAAGGADAQTQLGGAHGVGAAIGRRKGHVRADSDLFIAPAATAAAASSSADTRDPSPIRGDTQPLKISKSKSKSRSRGYSSSSSPNKPVFKRGFSWLKGADGDRGEEAHGMEDFELLQMPVSEHKKKSRSRSANSSPVKASSKSRARSGSKSNSVVDDVGTLPVISRDVLPKSPAQIMSPPLESQMCFTPIPLSIARMPPDGDGGLPSLGQVVDGGGIITAPIPARLGSKSHSRSKSRPGGDHDHMKPTKIPMPSKKPRFPVTAESTADYVEVGDFAPFRTPSHQKKGRGRSRAGSTSTPVCEREFEFFWTPKSLRKKDKKKDKDKDRGLGDYYHMTNVDAQASGLS